MCTSIHVEQFAYLDDHDHGQICKFIRLSSLLPPFLWHLTFFEMLFLILLVWCSLKDGMVGITLMNNAEVSVTVVIKSPR